MQVRNAAQALVQDKERVATQLADAVMQQSRLASDNARFHEDIERLQGGFDEVALAMDVLCLRQTGVHCTQLCFWKTFPAYPISAEYKTMADGQEAVHNNSDKAANRSSRLFNCQHISISSIQHLLFARYWECLQGMKSCHRRDNTTRAQQHTQPCTGSLKSSDRQCHCSSI